MCGHLTYVSMTRSARNSGRERAFSNREALQEEVATRMAHPGGRGGNCSQPQKNTRGDPYAPCGKCLPSRYWKLCLRRPLKSPTKQFKALRPMEGRHKTVFCVFSKIFENVGLARADIHASEQNPKISRKLSYFNTFHILQIEFQFQSGNGVGKKKN